MTDPKLTMGVYRYEHTEPLFDGRVAIDATLETSPLISDVFQRMAEGDLDVAEYGLTYFLRSFDLVEARRSWPCRSSRTAISGTRPCS